MIEASYTDIGNKSLSFRGRYKRKRPRKPRASARTSGVTLSRHRGRIRSADWIGDRYDRKVEAKWLTLNEGPKSRARQADLVCLYKTISDGDYKARKLDAATIISHTGLVRVLNEAPLINVAEKARK